MAPDSVPYKHLTCGLLLRRIMEASSLRVRQRAEVLGRLMREEKRVQNAVARLEQLLGAGRAKAGRS